MKKKVLSLLLCVILVFSTLTVTLQAASVARADTATAKRVQAAVTESRAGNGSILSGTKSKIDTADTAKGVNFNQILPADTMLHQSAVRGKPMTLHFILQQYGYYNQYLNVAVIDTDDLDGLEPENIMAAYIEEFDETQGAYDFTLTVETSTMAVGDYYVLIYTTQGSSYVYEDSVLLVPIHIVSKAQPIQTFYLGDPERSDWKVTDYRLNVGGEKMFSMIANPITHTADRAITVASSNTKVAEVYEYGGFVIVEGRGTGTATISAGMGGMKASFILQVGVPVTAIHLNQESLQLTGRQQVQLNYVVTPSNATYETVLWSSSNESVATVNNGLVNVIAAGETTITVSCNGVTAQCHITVASTVPATAVSLDASKTTLHIGEKYHMQAALTPSDSDDGLLWSSSDPAIATVDVAGVVTANAVGTVTIKAKALTGTAEAERTLTVEACPGEQFRDMPSLNNWAHAGIDYTISKGLFYGTDAGTFSPKMCMTRAMFVAVLYRMSGAEAPDVENQFSDVQAGTWYYESVLWAVENRVAFGMGDDRFGPHETITRAMLAALLYNYTVQCTTADSTTRADLSTYPDAPKPQHWNRLYLEWAVGVGLLSGAARDGQVLLDANGEATREQVASVLMRYMQNIIHTEE